MSWWLKGCYALAAALKWCTKTTIKKHSRTSPDLQFKEFSLTKQKTRPRWMDWENHLEKNPIQKIEKIVKNKIEIAACEQKTTSEKANFCSNTIFSLYFKIRAKKFHAAKALAFSLHFLFRRDQNHYSNLTSSMFFGLRSKFSV